MQITACLCVRFLFRKSAEILVVDTLMYIRLLWCPFFVRAVRPCFCYSRKIVAVREGKGSQGVLLATLIYAHICAVFSFVLSEWSAMLGLYAGCWSQSPEAYLRSSGAAKNKQNRPVFGCVECSQGVGSRTPPFEGTWRFQSALACTLKSLKHASIVPG